MYIYYGCTSVWIVVCEFGMHWILEVCTGSGHLGTSHHFFRARKIRPKIRAAAATATPPATSRGVKFSKGQGPRSSGPLLGALSSSAPSPGPLGSGVASGLLGAAGAGFKLLWLLRRAGSALAGVFLADGGVGAAGDSCFSG